MTLEAHAAGRDEHVEQLHSTCPTYEYQLPELKYYLQMQTALTLGLQALYDFQQCLLNYNRTKTRNQYRRQV